MATLASQPVTITGLPVAYAPASVGGDRFTPGDDIVLHVVNAGGSPVTITVPAMTAAAGSHVQDVAVTLVAGTDRLIGPFPAAFFADPADGYAHATYTGVTSVTVAAVSLTPRQAPARGTVITHGALTPSDLPSGSLVVLDSGDMYINPSPTAPATGVHVSFGTAVPTDLPDGTIYFQTTGGLVTDLYVAPGVSAASLLIVNAAPTDLGADQVAVLVGLDGVPTDLYIGS